MNMPNWPVTWLLTNWIKKTVLLEEGRFLSIQT